MLRDSAVCLAVGSVPGAVATGSQPSMKFEIASTRPGRYCFPY
jgi:hypothetical protein